MNEDRLRDAFAAGAAGASPSPGAYDAVVARRARRVRHRRLTVAGSAVATAAVVVGVAVALPAGTPPRPPVASPGGPPAPAPEWAIAITTHDWQARLLRLPGGETVDPPAMPGWVVTAVTAAGDGRTFYAAAAQGCVTRLLRIDRTAGAATREQVAGPHLSGRVTSLAVSGDGRRLAFGVRRPTRVAPNCELAAQGSVPEIWVRDLTTGAGRSWHGRPGEDTAAQHVVVQSVTLSPDGRHVAFDTDDCCDTKHDRYIRVLDTTAPGETFLVTPTLGGRRGFCETYSPAYRGAYGTLTAVRECGPDFTVVTLDPATGAETGELFTTTPNRGTWGAGAGRLDFDASGDHVLLEHDNVERPNGVARWDRDRGTVAPLGEKDVVDVRW